VTADMGDVGKNSLKELAIKSWASRPPRDKKKGGKTEIIKSRQKNGLTFFPLPLVD